MTTPAKTTLPLASVRFTNGLLAERAALVRDTVIPYQWEALNDRVPGAEPSGTVSNFQVAAGEKKGSFHGYWFQDSDLAKWIEAASFRLATHPDAKLDQELDGIIATISKAQQPDGYLDTYVQLVEPDKRWANLHEYHELYIAGHFIEAGVAHFEATEKRTLLAVVEKLADMIGRTFGDGPNQINGYCGHEEIELALLKLGRATGSARHTQLAAWFINKRGTAPSYFEEEFKRLGFKELPPYFYHDRWAYLQAHVPVREQTEPIGHSVRAMYLYTAMAGLAHELADKSLADACRTLWTNLCAHHIYITGGVGSEWMGEKFSERYNLPNDRAYAESCAGIGLIFFARRMLDLELRSEYADVMERALYNNVLAGMSHDGCRFFYVNPLEVIPSIAHRRYDARQVKTQRVGWFGCACCPPNIARTLASLAYYAFSAQPDGIAVHLYAGCQIKEVPGTHARVSITTDYPWDSAVRIEIAAPAPQKFALRLRIPSWCHSASAQLNGAALPLNDSSVHNGYLVIDREWRAGDIVELSFPMPVQRVHAHAHVADNAGAIALQRGPIVFCLEEIDNGPHLAAIRLPRESTLDAHVNAQAIGGCPVIEGTAKRRCSVSNDLYSTSEPLEKDITIKAVPYFLWANRGEGEMRVWIRE